MLTQVGEVTSRNRRRTNGNCSLNAPNPALDLRFWLGFLVTEPGYGSDPDSEPEPAFVARRWTFLGLFSPTTY